MDDALVVDVRQGGTDGGSLAAHAVVALDVAPVPRGAGQTPAAHQVFPAISYCSDI